MNPHQITVLGCSLQLWEVSPVSSFQFTLGVIGLQTYTPASIASIFFTQVPSSSSSGLHNKHIYQLNHLPAPICGFYLKSLVSLSFSFSISELFRSLRLCIHQDLEYTWSTELLCTHPLFDMFSQMKLCQTSPSMRLMS